MALAQGLRQDSYAWTKADRDQGTQPKHSISTLERIIGSGDLRGQLEAFLLTCKVEGFTEQTIDGYRLKLSLLVRFLNSLGITNPQQVNINHIRLFILEKQKTVNGVSINTIFRHIRRWFNWMVEEGILPVSPMAGMKAPRIPKTIIQPFQPEHIKALLAVCDSSFVGTRNKALVLTFYDTGLRLFEMVSIKLSDIDLERGCIKVWGKGAKERLVGLGKTSQKAIYRYLLMRHDTNPYLWITEERDKPLKRFGVVILIRRMGVRANLQGVRCSPHTFRHAFGTNSLKNGASVFEVQSLLGHSTLDMTRRYAATLNSEQSLVSHKRFSPADNIR